MSTPTYRKAATWFTISAGAATLAYIFGKNPLTLTAALGIGATAYYFYTLDKKEN